MIPKTNAMAISSKGNAIPCKAVIFSFNIRMPYNTGITRLLHCIKVVNDIGPYFNAFKKNSWDAAVTIANRKDVMIVNKEALKCPVKVSVIKEAI